MKMLHVPLLVVGLLLCSQGFAATPQQEKMTTCNAEATAKSLKAAPAAPMSQQDKMTMCNKVAGEKALKGDERKAFMSDCLKKK